LPQSGFDPDRLDSKPIEPFKSDELSEVANGHYFAIDPMQKKLTEIGAQSDGKVLKNFERNTTLQSLQTKAQ